MDVISFFVSSLCSSGFDNLAIADFFDGKKKMNAS